MDTELSIVIPAYNEEECIEATYKELQVILSKIDKSYEIIFIDDGSTDGTADLIKTFKNINFLQHSTNRGYGAALKRGISHANGRYILITDADGTYPIKEIPQLLSWLGDYDMVVGARTGESVSIPLYRKPAKWFLSKLANYLSGTKIPDLNSGLRVFRKEDVRRFYNILPNGFSFTTTITLSFLSNGLTIKYLPICYNKRVVSSKIRPFRDGLNFILLIFKCISYFNPLKIFLPISFALFFSAVIIMLYSILKIGAYLETTIVILLEDYDQRWILRPT